MRRKRLRLNATIMILLLAPALLMIASPIAGTKALAQSDEDIPYVVQDLWGKLWGKLPLSFEAVQVETTAGDVIRFHLRGAGYTFVPDGTQVSRMTLLRDQGNILPGVPISEYKPILKPKATGLDPLPWKIHY